MCTYSRLFNTSQLMPSESVLLSGKTIQFGPVVELKSLGFSHIILMILAEVPLSVPARLASPSGVIPMHFHTSSMSVLLFCKLCWIANDCSCIQWL